MTVDYVTSMEEWEKDRYQINRHFAERHHTERCLFWMGMWWDVCTVCPVKTIVSPVGAFRSNVNLVDLKDPLLYGD